MSSPDKIDKIFEMLVRRTMRKGGTKRINPKKQLINAYFEICFHEYILKSFNLEEKLGSIMQFHPEYASDDKENTSTKQECMFKYDYFQSLTLPEALELVNLVREALGKSLHPVLVARSSLDWMPSRVNSLYSDIGAWSGKFRPVMDEIESDEALRFYQFLNYLDGGSFGTGPIDEFVDAMNRLATYMKQQNSRETQVRGMRELEAINGEKGNSIKTVLEVSTVIMRKKRKFFCTGEVKEPIVNNKIICKDRILLPIAGPSCRDAIMYWHPSLTEEHYCVGALEAKSPVHIMYIEGEMFCKGDDYSKREYLLACDFYEDQEAPVADLLQYYPDPDPEIAPKLF